jgi:TPR repeat protein
MSSNGEKARAYLITIYLFVSCSLLIIAFPLPADNSGALSAYTNADFQNALKLWQEPANSGDATAQYNLSLMYANGVGVLQDSNLAQYWLRMAASQGMVQAYLSLNPGGLKPDNQRRAVIASRAAVSPQQWVAVQDPAHYTLQLASSTNQALIRKYYEENRLQGKAGYYGSVKQGETWYALVYGTYPTVNEAKLAITDLPQSLRKWSPWARNIASIHKIMIRP